MSTKLKKRFPKSYLLWGALLILLPGPGTIWNPNLYMYGQISFTVVFDVLDRLPQVLGFLLLWFGCAKLPSQNQRRLNNVLPLLFAFLAVGQAYCIYTTARQTAFSILCLCVMAAGQVWMALWIQRLPAVLEIESSAPPRRRIIPAVYAAISALCVLGAVIPGKPSLLIILSRISRVALIGFSIWLVADLWRTVARFQHLNHTRSPQG